MEIKFTKRNEEELNCRFCGQTIDDTPNLDLFETSPVKGIVCECCKEHLEDYVEKQ